MGWKDIASDAVGRLSGKRVIGGWGGDGNRLLRGTPGLADGKRVTDDMCASRMRRIPLGIFDSEPDTAGLGRDGWQDDLHALYGDPGLLRCASNVFSIAWRRGLARAVVVRLLQAC
jgi:hypothetical protein